VNVESLLQTIPPWAVYLVVGLVIGLESLGIPLPGEIALVAAALLASRHTLDISPVGVGAAATIGAIVGDTIGYSIGHRYGMGLFERLGRRNSSSPGGACGPCSSAGSSRCCASSQDRSRAR
jgi:membrane protein DedA with SNARE-associated domain